MELIVAPEIPVSPARVDTPDRAPLRVALVQHCWHDDADLLAAELTAAIGQAAGAGAEVVFLSEITLLRYPAFERGGARPSALAEDLLTGPTFAFAAAAAKQHDVVVHASLYERHPDAEPLGYNTATMVSPSGELLARTRKLHIPVTAGYYEDTYFRCGPAQADGADPYPVHAPAVLGGARFGLPTCWDEWFPEVARAYSLGGADVIAYPTAIGSEPDHPAFDTAPLWRQVIVGNGISSGTFMVVPNRWGNEGAITFYGSSFISDPYGRILVEAPRDASAVLVADLDLDQRRDWLTLFPFLATRRPDTYGPLVEPVAAHGPLGGAQLGGVR
ncbi:nitrilase-related carbon-nitrogen hydrolase [Tsukamurella paurometabola]|uniref:Hydrolase n=1 Tax=Tsukamurella paurometabola TaxID=2061 RepID=A0ABS5NI45_TSUPA|nr:nitrilase-related carbon-nitrogen hydrolase [Tsukamurella paurometabola]MBS4103542.1 hydrolase [Tsukamurella paurometabola]